MQRLDHSYEVLYSELAERALDAAFTSDFSLDGRFVSQASGARRYWYFDTAKPDGAGKRRLYVGPVDDPDITRRVEAFKDLKADHRARRKLVSTLVREAHLPRPPALAGQLVEALAAEGFFRLRGVLIGTAAYQAYGPLLGVRMPQAALQTGDVDLAKFQAISLAVDDALPPMLPLLQQVDSTFREVPHPADSRRATAFVCRSGYRVEFLTPSVGRAERDGAPARMPTLGGAAAQPLRFLDFLIHEPVRAVLLHGAGVPVLVPAPERYAVHKLIVAARRRSDRSGAEKAAKDRRQAAGLFEVLATLNREADLFDAYAEAWARGPAWRDAITSSLGRLDEGARLMVQETLRSGAAKLKADAAIAGVPPA